MKFSSFCQVNKDAVTSNLIWLSRRTIGIYIPLDMSFFTLLSSSSSFSFSCQYKGIFLETVKEEEEEEEKDEECEESIIHSLFLWQGNPVCQRG